MNLVQLFQETCVRHPSKPALVWGDRSWTFLEVRQEALRIAGALKIRRGDRVGIFLPNGPETVFTHLAVMMAGGIRVPINAAYTVREAEHPIRFTACRAVVTDEARRRAAEEAGAPLVLVAPRGPVPEELPDPHELSLICFTSGTSGKPKGVPLSHRNLVSNIRALVSVWEWTDRDTLLLCLPLMHLHGLGNGLNGWIATGCTLVLQEKFQPEAVFPAVEKHRATLFFGVPAMYHKLLDVERAGDISSIRLWVSGSAALDRGLAQLWEARTGQRIVNRYGMTETVMITANPASGERRLGSVGKALPDTELRILDAASGREAAPGETGEIVVRGPGVAAHYWGETEPLVHRDGYFRTGDLGYRDADGYVFITGRAKDIIISGGTNIAPAEIEEVLLGHPQVAEAIALPAPDAALGEVVHAVVVPRGALTVEDLASWCEKNLAKYKRPRQVKIVPGPLPRNAMQKLDRKKAKELYGA